MQIIKVRVTADQSGLVPAGVYFERLAQGLRTARRPSMRAEGEDRALEARRRRRRAA